MATYGLTPQGPNIKRLDVILEEMHEDMSKKLSVNTRQNPQSLLNHILTNISDRIAELWEFGLDVYHSQYPSTATDSSFGQCGPVRRQHKRDARKVLLLHPLYGRRRNGGSGGYSYRQRYKPCHQPYEPVRRANHPVLVQQGGGSAGVRK